MGLDCALDGADCGPQREKPLGFGQQRRLRVGPDLHRTLAANPALAAHIELLPPTVSTHEGRIAIDEDALTDCGLSQVLEGGGGGGGAQRRGIDWASGRRFVGGGESSGSATAIRLTDSLRARDSATSATAQLPARIVLLKVDIEGGEAEAWPDLAALIAVVRVDNVLID